MSEKASAILITHTAAGAGAAAFVRKLSSGLALGGSVLVLGLQTEDLWDPCRLFSMPDSPKKFSDAEELDLAPQMIRSYLNTGISNVGLVLVDSEDDIVNAIAEFSGIYGYIIIDSGRAFDPVKKEIFSLVGRLLIFADSGHHSILSAFNQIRGLKRIGANSALIDVVVSSSGLEEELPRSAVEEKFRNINHFFLPDEFPAILNNITFSGDVLISPPRPAVDRLKTEIVEKLSDVKEIKKLISGDGMGDGGRPFLEQKIESAVHEILDSDPVAGSINRPELIKGVIDEAIGLGPLEKFMKDPDVTEVMVNAVDEIYIEKAGRLSRAEERFSGTKSMMSIIERIVAPVGRRIDESSPVVDARLADGSRVHVVIPPLALKGPAITIRKFSKSVLSIDDLIFTRSMSAEIASFLKKGVENRMNILVSGGTGSGKTTMLNLVSSFIPEGERIVTIEDSAELKLAQPHVVRLEARPPNIEGRGEITIRDLVKASLRMRPDRIVVGEVRGAEALDMLQAMNTGHEGSLTTIHANSCRDSLARLETLVMFAGFDFPVKAIREQIASAINLIIQVKRLRDGSRKIVNISEITGLEGEVITTQELFVYRDGVHASMGFGVKFTGS